MAIPTPYAGSYYPIYNSGTNQWIQPTVSMPFGKISALFVAFAHAYPTGYNYQGDVNQSSLALEASQPLEPMRLIELAAVARSVNPRILIFISLGWGHYDWDYINADYEAYSSGQTTSFNFAQSVVSLIRAYQLDGFDIDDESIGGSSGSISQQNFSAVVQLIRDALNQASDQDGKPYYFSITPAFGTALITNDNIGLFDLINTQNYGGSSWSNFKNFPNANKGLFAYGVDSEGGTAPLPTPADVQGMAGAFNWTLSADSNYGYKYTNDIASIVGYPPQ